MNQVNKIHLFDVCVDGNIEKFRALINPMYDHFSRFYKSYKESFVNDSEAVENIIFENNSDVASFTVVDGAGSMLLGASVFAGASLRIGFSVATSALSAEGTSTAAAAIRGRRPRRFGASVAISATSAIGDSCFSPSLGDVAAMIRLIILFFERRSSEIPNAFAISRNSSMVLLSRVTKSCIFDFLGVFSD